MSDRYRRILQRASVVAWMIGGALMTGPLALFVLSSDTYYASLFRPVVQMRGVLQLVDADSAVITVVGRKTLPCELIREPVVFQVYAHQPHELESRDDVQIHRYDGAPIRGDSKPIGDYAIGPLLIRPVYAGDVVELFVRHDCNGRRVSTRIAQVTIPHPR